MLDFVIFAVTFLVGLIIAIIWVYPSSKIVTTIPGMPPSSKEDGNFGDIARAGSLHEFLMDLHSRFGSIASFWWGQTYMVSIASPELAKEHSNVFDRPPILFKNFEPLIGPRSIQFANGADGRGRRKTYDNLFAFDKMPQYLDCFEELAKKFEAKWMDKQKDDHIPLSVDCFMFAIHAASLAMMGDFYKEEKVFLKFKSSYEQVFEGMENTIIKGLVRDKQQEKHYQEAMNFLHSSIKQVIAHRRNNSVYQQEGLLLDVLIENSPDDETILADAVSYLVGGFHTTGNLIIWAIYFIATHKDVQDKLYKEIKKVIGDEGSVDKSNFVELVYLAQVLDETLRCAVVAPFAARFQDFDSELGGHRVPKGTPVVHALGVMMKDEKLWPLPNKFDPDRFSPENRKKMSSYMYVPFGFAGKRKCPGYRFAYWDSSVFLVQMLRRFEIHMCEDQVVTPVFGLVTHPEDEIWVKVTKRK